MQAAEVEGSHWSRRPAAAAALLGWEAHDAWPVRAIGRGRTGRPRRRLRVVLAACGKAALKGRWADVLIDPAGHCLFTCGFALRNLHKSPDSRAGVTPRPVANVRAAAAPACGDWCRFRAAGRGSGASPTRGRQQVAGGRRCGSALPAGARGPAEKKSPFSTSRKRGGPTFGQKFHFGAAFRGRRGACGPLLHVEAAGRDLQNPRWRLPLYSNIRRRSRARLRQSGISDQNEGLSVLMVLDRSNLSSARGGQPDAVQSDTCVAAWAPRTGAGRERRRVRLQPASVSKRRTPAGCWRCVGGRRRKAISCTFFSVCCAIADRFGSFRSRSGRFQRHPIYKPVNHHSSDLRFCLGGGRRRGSTNALVPATNRKKCARSGAFADKRATDRKKCAARRLGRCLESAPGRRLEARGGQRAGPWLANPKTLAGRMEPRPVASRTKPAPIVAGRGVPTISTVAVRSPRFRLVRPRDLWRSRKANPQVDEP